MPQDRDIAGQDEARALAELALCENLSQTSGWAAKWSADLARADGALLWAPDTIHPLFLCIAAHGEGTAALQRRSVPRASGFVQDLIRSRKPLALDRDEIASSSDPWLAGLPRDLSVLIAVPLEAESIVVGLLALLFRSTPNTRETLARLHAFFEHAAPALGRALRSERKTIGMLHAIERLTNLYDLTKAFGSTIDLDELNGVIVRKAADFGSAEVASFWLLDENIDMVLAATAVNDNYEVAHAPDAVGSSVVGDLISEGQPLRKNGILADTSIAMETVGYPIRSMLAFPLAEDDQPIGALVLANKRGRHPEFSAEDEELLGDLARQAVRALRNARQYEAEKRVEELDALLAVSREITATLDLDRVMQTVVNGASALVTFDRAAIAIQDRGRLRLGAVSGKAEIDRTNPEIRRMEELAQWVFLSGSDVNVTLQPDGSLSADRPETEEKFRSLFSESGLKAFYGTMLKDEEGKLGVLVFECKEPLLFDAETRDLLSILVNQATVAVRNAQLYRQVPLVGFWRPLLEKRRKVLEVPARRRIAWALGAALVFVVLFFLPWRLRLSGPARVLPGRRAVVTAGVDGLVNSVLRREGDAVREGDVIATLWDEDYQSSLAEARATESIVESELARARSEANATATFDAQARRDELRARITMEEQRLARTKLTAPAGGIIVTPRLEERVGQVLHRGAEFCVVADVATATVEVAIDEEDATLLSAGQPAVLKLNPFPTRSFSGEVSRVGARIREEGKEHFIIAEVRVANADAALKTGMLGKAKIRVGYRRIATLLLRRPARWLYAKLWPLMP